MKKILLPGLGLGAWVVALLIQPIAEGVKSGAVDVYLLIPHQDKNTVEANEFLFSAKPTDPDYDKQIMQIYGVPTEKREKVLVDASKIVHAKQKPGLAWLPVDKTKGENPLQAKTVDFVAKLLSAGAVETGMLLLVTFLMFKLAAPAPGARSAAG